MNRTELADAVSAKTGLTKHAAEAAVEAVVETVVAELRAGDRVSVFGFGTFSVGSRAAHMARNPQTQAAVRVPARKVVKFQAATAFKAALNKGKAAAPKKSAAAKKAAPAKKAGVKKAPAKKAPAKAVKSAKKR